VSPLDIIMVSLAETSIICRFVGSTGQRLTHLRRSPLAIGNEGQGAAASTGKTHAQPAADCLFRRPGAHR